MQNKEPKMPFVPRNYDSVRPIHTWWLNMAQLPNWKDIRMKHGLWSFAWNTNLPRFRVENPPKLAIQVSSIFLLNENRRNPVSTGMGESHAYVMPSKGSDQS